MELKTIENYHSKPSTGKTMVGMVKLHGSLVYECYIRLCEIIESISLPKSELDDLVLGRTYFGRPENCEFSKSDKIKLIAASFLLDRICGRITGELGKSTTFFDAQKWRGTDLLQSARKVSELIDKKIEPTFIEKLDSLSYSSIQEVLPYLLEVFETEEELLESTGSGRVKKKNNGIYYTPSDVTNLMVNGCFERYARHGGEFTFENLSWLDPAVGTGGFLVAILNNHISSKGLSALYDFYREKIFGIDISALALQSCNYIMALYCYGEKELNQFAEALRYTGVNLYLKDSTELNSKVDLRKIFQNIDEEGVDFIISNPPYSYRQLFQSNLFNEFESSGVKEKLYPSFFSLIQKLTKKNLACGGAMVVPLAITYNSSKQHKEFRKSVFSSKGIYEFLNFDRTPDSLFGDDVKTRNTIAFYNYMGEFHTEVYSSYLNRWSSGNRSQFLKNIPTTKIIDISMIKGIPKVGDQKGANLLVTIEETNKGVLGDIIERAKGDVNLYVKRTAYNWLPIEMSSTNENSNGWIVSNEKVPIEAVFAVLNSGLSYWLWRVYGDGFHLTSSFIRNLPFGIRFFENTDLFKLKELGEQLWDEMRQSEVISKNAGKVSKTHSPLNSLHLIEKIDVEIMKAFNLPGNLSEYLLVFRKELKNAGREKVSISERLKEIA